ncbi:hypothetical protein [Streptomyces sp. NPDC006446]|uniref:hypothetical protein n=1 Tax=Streptomyces sp. NPDC006446 TaxID=3154301 RepID=UPI0033A688A9
MVYTSLRTTDRAGLEEARTRLRSVPATQPGATTPAPALWVWDDAEAVTRWNDVDRDRLLRLLTEVAGRGVRTLITSRDGATWLPPDTERVALGTLSHAERAEFVARTLGPDAAPMLEPLLHFSQGNPVVLRALCRRPPYGEAVDGAVEKRLEALRAGTGRPLETDGDAPPPQSVTADLRAFFDEREQRVLSLLLFFRTNVAAVHLTALAQRLDRLGGALQKTSLDYHCAVRLLAAVADLGWLTPLRADFHAIHPLLPCALRPLLDDWADEVSTRTTHQAFAEHYDQHGHALFWTHQRGAQGVLDIMTLDHDNLLRAQQTALELGMTDEVVGPMQALRELYHETSRRQRWLALVASLSQAPAGPAMGGSLRPDLVFRDESVRPVITDYLRDLDLSPERTGSTPDGQDDAEGQDATALHAQEQEAAPPPSNDAERVELRNEAIRLLDDNSGPSLHRAVDLAHRSGDQRLEASALIDLGHWYRSLGEPRYDRVAHSCFEESHSLAVETDRLTHARVLDGLGALHLGRVRRLADERLQQLVRTGEIDTSRPGRFTVDLPEEAIGELVQAESYYVEALALFADGDRTVARTTASLHHQLGGIYQMTNDVERATRHFQQAIQAHDESGDVLRAAHSRQDFANFLVHRGDRVADARLYAERALHDFLSLGEPQREQAEGVRHLVEWLREEKP